MFENIYTTLQTKVDSGSKCAVLTYLDFNGAREGSISNKLVIAEEELIDKSISLDLDIYDKIMLSLNTGRLQFIHKEERKAVLIESFFPKPRLVIFGGGHISKPLSELAARVGFSVVVIDDRPFFANKSRFPEADRVLCESFERAFDLVSLNKSDYVVIITRGHRYDGIVLREVLNHELLYAGMIGSKRRVRGMKEELLAEGFSSEKLEGLHAPIGLDISAVTPDEIAISIIAELISCKNKTLKSELGETFSFPEFDREVAEKAAGETDIPKALITILSSKGSVPRKAGAKMVTFLDGRSFGSIGGGCSEASVLTKAREIMASKGFLIEFVDMTGDVAESEGMVCGGTMEVLVEAF